MARNKRETITIVRRYEADTSQWTKALSNIDRSAAQTAKSMKTMEDRVERTTGLLKSFGAGLAGALSAVSFAGITGAARRLSEFAKSVEDASQRTSIIGDTIEALGRQAVNFGGSLDQTVDTLDEFTLRLAEAAREGGPVADLLQQIGLNAADLAGDPTRALETIRQKLVQINDPGMRAVIADTLFGEDGGKVLVQQLSTLGQSVDSFTRQMDDMKRVYGAETRRELAAYASTANELNQTLDVLGARTLGPVVQGMNVLAKDLVAVSRLDFSNLGDLNLTLQAWGQVLAGAGAGAMLGGRVGGMPGALAGGAAGALFGMTGIDSELEALEKQAEKLEARMLEISRKRAIVNPEIGLADTFAREFEAARQSYIEVKQKLQALTAEPVVLPQISIEFDTGGGVDGGGIADSRKLIDAKIKELNQVYELINEKQKLLVTESSLGRETDAIEDSMFMLEDRARMIEEDIALMQQRAGVVVDTTQMEIDATRRQVEASQQAADAEQQRRDTVDGLIRSTQGLLASLDARVAFDMQLTESAKLLADAEEAGVLSAEKRLFIMQKVEEQHKRLVDSYTATTASLEGLSLRMKDTAFVGFNSWVDSAVMGTFSLKDALVDLTRQFIALAAKVAIFKAVSSMFGGTDFTGLFGLQANAMGNAFPGGVSLPQGIYNDPTIFKFAKGGSIGLLGEAGSEAILPLSRMSNGDLGVKSEPAKMVVNVNNNARGVEVSSRQVDAQTIELTIKEVEARLARGGNSTSRAFDSRYRR